MEGYLMSDDHGYTHICPKCTKRYGAQVKGVRTLTIKHCQPCEKKVAEEKNKPQRSSNPRVARPIF